MSGEPDLLIALVTIFFGAIAGGLTNTIAIWMLFHPYEPRGPRGLKLQGAIPKNKARLAKTIGRTVGERLLTFDDLARRLSTPAIREAFDEAIGTFVVGFLETERGSLREELPAPVVEVLEEIKGNIAGEIVDYLAELLESEGFRETLAAFQERLAEDLAERPVGELLTLERRVAFRQRAAEWVSEAVQGPELRASIGTWLDRQVERLEQDPTPLVERLPPAVSSALDRQISSYLPVALERIAAVLGDPTFRDKIQASLHQLFERLVDKMMLHERIVAWLLVTEETFDRLLTSLESEGVDELSRLLDEPIVRHRVTRSVSDAVTRFLQRPLTEHFENLGPERVAGLKETVQQQVVAAVRDQAVQGFVLDQVDGVLESFAGRSLGDLLRRLPPSEIAGWMSELLATDEVRGPLGDGLATVLGSLLDRPVGRPGSRLPDGAAARVQETLSATIWEWVQEQVPTLIERLDVQQMVEDKVMEFSLERLENMVRRVARREFALIIRLGYVLGAIVGALAYVTSLVLA